MIQFPANLKGSNFDSIKELVESKEWVKRVSIKKVLPSTLIINVIENDPSAVYFSEGKSFLIDLDGSIITEINIDNYDDSEGKKEEIKNIMARETDANGNKIFTLASGISLLLFYAFAMQCMSTLAIVKKETNSWKWPILQFIIMTALAYFISLISFQILS